MVRHTDLAMTRTKRLLVSFQIASHLHPRSTIQIIIAKPENLLIQMRLVEHLLHIQYGCHLFINGTNAGKSRLRVVFSLLIRCFSSLQDFLRSIHYSTTDLYNVFLGQLTRWLLWNSELYYMVAFS